jgi:hypothetical protein
MNFEEGRQAILRQGAHHSGSGLIDMLRPYHGLREEYFHELVAAIRAVAPSLRMDAHMDPELMGSLWSILVYVHSYALAPNCSLQQNHLISPQDLATLHDWVRTIGFLVCGLQAGGEVHYVFESYDERYPPDVR